MSHNITNFSKELTYPWYQPSPVNCHTDPYGFVTKCACYLLVQTVLHFKATVLTIQREGDFIWLQTRIPASGHFTRPVKKYREYKISCNHETDQKPSTNGNSQQTEIRSSFKIKLVLVSESTQLCTTQTQLGNRGFVCVWLTKSASAGGGGGYHLGKGCNTERPQTFPKHGNEPEVSWKRHPTPCRICSILQETISCVTADYTKPF